MLLDLDHFKQINDLFGHEKGDEVLAAVGASSRARCATSDFVGRYGGEEFIVLLPDTGREGALEVAEKLRARDRARRRRRVSSARSRPASASPPIPEDALRTDALLRTPTGRSTSPRRTAATASRRSPAGRLAVRAVSGLSSAVPVMAGV